MTEKINQELLLLLLFIKESGKLIHLRTGYKQHTLTVHIKT